MKTVCLFVDQLGSPPQVLGVTWGNTSNTRLREILPKSLPSALKLLQRGEPPVGIRDAYVPLPGTGRATVLENAPGRILAVAVTADVRQGAKN